MEYKKINAGIQFSMNYKHIIDLINNQVQRGYGRIKDYIDKVIDNQKSNYNKTMKTIDNIVDKYIIDKKKIQPIYLK